jgi:DNA invertase Pin-like site-specific DNA recombinase
MIIGYGRVSADGQSLESQLASLRAAGAEKVCSGYYRGHGDFANNPGDDGQGDGGNPP